MLGAVSVTVRRFSSEEKRTIVMAYLSGARMAEVRREHQVSGPTVYRPATRQALTSSISATSVCKRL